MSLGKTFISIPAKILDFLIRMHLEKPKENFTRYEIAKGADVTARSVIRYLPKLVELGFIQKTRKIDRKSRLFLYKLTTNETTQFIIDFTKKIKDEN